jgi:penicillin-binding protein 1B
VAIKIKIPRRKKSEAGKGFLSKDPLLRLGLVALLVVFVFAFGWFSYYYVKYERIIDQRFKGGVFTSSAQIYAIPKTVRIGEKIDAHHVALDLRRAGYTDNAGGSPMGTFHQSAGSIEIKPGPQSYHSQQSATIHFTDGKVDSISGSAGSLPAYELEPEIVTSLFDAEQRSKRELIKYNDIPTVMVNAVVAIEDRRFFQHSGVNFIRLIEATWVDLTHQKHEQGGSTITMQLSRAFFLSPEKTVKRKAIEILIATELEHKFSKQQIFEFYANRVDLGQRGSFTISGFGQASHAYFNKDLKDITLPEAALLAGLIQAPSYLSPYRHPERALERRNLVLDSMVETHAITPDEAKKAKATPLQLAPPNVEASDAPYFVDLVRDTVISRLSEREMNEQAYRIYTTLDPDLQRAAAQAVEAGMKLVDAEVTKRRTKKVKVGKTYETHVEPGPQAQVALVAMDPHTGQVLALVGGRNYGFSQLDHAVAKRPTGSIFKPFVYAAAINTAFDGSPNVITPVSIVQDEPTTFAYGDQIYEPRNYKEEYHGDVPIRYALAMSLNNATVKLAEEVGYDKVADLARNAGIASVKPTPAMALGSYDATPLEMASAYTVFANGGTRISPLLVNSVRNSAGDVLVSFKTDTRPVLDPRVTAVMTNMMEGVLNFGTAFTVRSSGFNAPAAGKTGTSHDGWFAGYTSNLLCIVWVGYDDYSDIRLSGAQTAAPIWTEFMKRAVLLPEYADVRSFAQPDGVVQVQIDKNTNLLATNSCPQTYLADFIAGTEPKQTCDQPVGVTGFFSRIGHAMGFGVKPLPPPSSGAQGKSGTPEQPSDSISEAQNPADAQAAQKKKKGFIGKITGIFKEDKTSNPPAQTPSGSGNGNSPP